MNHTSRRGPVRPLGAHFPDNDCLSIHYTAYYNLFVTIHSVFQQRNIVRQADDKDAEQNILWNTADQSSAEV